mgnify:CR=1 FL=1
MIYLFVFNYFCFRVHYLLTSADFAENTPSKRRCNLRMVRNSFLGAPNKTVHRVHIVENDLFPKTLGKTALFSLLDIEKKLCGKPVSI